MWTGHGNEFMPIPQGIVSKYPRYEMTSHPTSESSQSTPEEAESPIAAKSGPRQAERRRRTAIPQSELASPSRFAHDQFPTTKAYTLPAYFVMPQGTILGDDLKVPGLTMIKSGFTLPAEMRLTSGICLSATTVIPAGTVIPLGARIPDSIELPGSSGFLGISPPPSPVSIADLTIVDPDEAKRNMPDTAEKLAMLDQPSWSSALTRQHAESAQYETQTESGSDVDHSLLADE
jgi:hypothetical protein